MINATQFLKDYTNNLVGSLLNPDLNNNFNTVTSILIDCENLPMMGTKCEGVEAYDNVFGTLHNNGMNDKPALYWFEIISGHTADQIRNSYLDIKKSIGQRTIPATHNKYNSNSKVLYVGKAKSKISGRMFMHLGYEKRESQQGLQLCHWNYSGELAGLQLKLNVIYLPADWKEIVPIYEVALAKELQPILGKHL